MDRSPRRLKVLKIEQVHRVANQLRRTYGASAKGFRGFLKDPRRRTKRRTSLAFAARITLNPVRARARRGRCQRRATFPTPGAAREPGLRRGVDAQRGRRGVDVSA